VFPFYGSSTLIDKRTSRGFAFLRGCIDASHTVIRLFFIAATEAHGRDRDLSTLANNILSVL